MSPEGDCVAYPVLDVGYEEADIIDVVSRFKVEDVVVHKSVQECLEDDRVVVVGELLCRMNEDVLKVMWILDGEFGDLLVVEVYDDPIVLD